MRSNINEDDADWLGLEGEPVSLNVQLLNDTTARLRSRSVQFDLESWWWCQKNNHSLDHRKCPGNMHTIIWVAEENRWSHLSEVHFQTLGRRPIIDMLIRLDLSDLHCYPKEIKGSPGEPIARLTPLGWRQALDHFRKSCHQSDVILNRCRTLTNPSRVV